MTTFYCVGRRPNVAEKGSTRRDEGQVIVEAALTLLLFFTFLLALFEGGRLLWTQQSLTQAAREGARYAVLPFTKTSTLPDCNEIRAVVRTYLQASSIDLPDSSIKVWRDYPAPNGGTTVFSRVDVEYTFQWWVLSFLGIPDLSLSGNSMMRNETSPASPVPAANCL